MNADQIAELGKEVAQALTEAEDVVRERDMLRRVLRQAVLTHGGRLVIDPSFAEAAGNDKLRLFIGGGGVNIVH